MPDLVDPVADPVAADPEAGLVWYVAYGSNLSSQRLGCYLAGGRPPGGSRVNPGARDPRPPRRTAPVDLPGTTYFAGASPQWGGGVAFYDHDRPGRTAARAYLVTIAQFVDIAAQEMHRVPAAGDPLEQVLDAGADGPFVDGRHVVGRGRYETLRDLGTLDGHRLLTFTAPGSADAVPHTTPAAAYLATMAAGLRESRDWSEAEIEAYLAALVS